jgi:hypothetical protein
VRVHYGDNDDLIAINAIKNSKWKSPNKTTTDISAQDGPSCRMLLNVLDGTVNGVKKLLAKSGLLGFIKLCRLCHFEARRR